jgi:hypothetical protein
VTNNRIVAVGEWSSSEGRVIGKARPGRIWSPGAIGLVGTLMLHAVIVLAVAQAYRVSAPIILKPQERLVFIDLPNSTRASDERYQTLAWLTARMNFGLIRAGKLDLPSVQSLELDEDRQSESSANAVDAAEHARLIGIYSGQIQARIERVWSRPRTPVNEANSPVPQDALEFFRCQAQIVQDSLGNVQEVLLPNCNGSVAWQHSLVVAIQQASPLPAPPSPTVFSHVVTLNFVGYPYIAGGSNEGYEISAAETARVTLPAKTPEEVSREFSSFRSTEEGRTQ